MESLKKFLVAVAYFATFVVATTVGVILGLVLLKAVFSFNFFEAIGAITCMYGLLKLIQKTEQLKEDIDYKIWLTYNS